MKIPFVDLFAQYQTIKDEIDSAIESTIRNSSYIGGDSVRKFEIDFANYLGVKEVVGCANGTDSLELILKAWGVGPGDEVIVPAHSWISTCEAVDNVGAIPVFVDIDKDLFTIDVKMLERAITNNTKVIIPVHLFGLPADMPSIMSISEKFDLKVLEDCAQAHGAMIGGRLVGSWGHAASFSFYPGKNLGAYGDAGCIATNDLELAKIVRMMANHGQHGKHNHQIVGRNSRLDGLQAAILSAKLPFLDIWTQKRIELALEYTKFLKELVICPAQPPNYKHVFHLFVIKVAERMELISWLKDNGVEPMIHYPKALPFLPCYESRHFKESDFPNAAQNQSQILSLPLYPEMPIEACLKVSILIRQFFKLP